MVDLTTIALAAVLGFGLITIDAATNADTFGVHIHVPPEIEKRGVSREVAESVFSSEVARVSQTPSLLAPPAVRSTSEKTLVSAFSKAVHFDDITFAVQRALGFNPVRLTGTLMPGETPRFFLTASSSATGSFTIDIRGEGTDYIDLVRRGARLTLERVGPYRAALYHFSVAAEDSGDFSTAEAIALRELGEPPRPHTIEMRALMHNLLGIIALMRKDVAAAEIRFRRALEEHPDLAVGYLNLAFVKLHVGRYEEAIEAARRVLQPKEITKVPQLHAAAETIWGVAAWALGRHAEAEELFGLAVQDYWGTTATYEYWSLMLEELGRFQEAEIKNRLSIANRPYFENFPEVAMLYFNLSHNEREPLTRRPQY